MAYVPPHRRGKKNITGNGGSLSEPATSITNNSPANDRHDSSLEELVERSCSYIPATEFQANYHLNVRVSWGIADYKVHAPYCSCWHMRELRNNNSTPSNNQHNNLLVVAKPIGNVFFSEETGVVAYEDDAKSCELKLANELFADNKMGIEIKPKVSCAQCLLTANDKKNGFLGIFSHSLEEIQATVDSARNTESMEKDQGILHSRNHADFVSAIEVSSLQSWLQGGSVHATNEVLNQIIDGGVADVPYHNVRLKVTHPLETLLTYMSSSSSFENLTYVMIWGFIDGPHTVQIDLIGGKRHLGESTLECALRKADKECSLKIDEGWLKSQVSSKYGGSFAAEMSGDSEVKVLVPSEQGSHNVFFIMPPPKIWDIVELVEGALDDGYGIREYEYEDIHGEDYYSDESTHKSRKIGKNRRGKDYDRDVTGLY